MQQFLSFTRRHKTYFCDVTKFACLLGDLTWLCNRNFLILVGSACPVADGFFYDSRTMLCIKFYRKAVNYQAAVNSCNGSGNSLVKIDTPQKQAVVYNYILSKLSIGSKSNNSFFILPLLLKLNFN